MKEHPIDCALRAERELQNAAYKSGRARPLCAVLLSVTAALLIGLGAATLLKPPKTFSEEENRILEGYPRFTPSRFLSGAFTADVGTFYADQFPLRNFFVGAKACTEVLLGKQENNGVLLGKDGYLIDRLDYGAREYGNLDGNAAAVTRIARLCEEHGLPFVFAIAPRTVDVMASAFPALYDGSRAESARKRLTDGYPAAIDLSVPLRGAAESGEPVMYRTDHHWTTRGAYLAYVALGDALGYDPSPWGSFSAETVSESFYGTTYSSSGVKWAVPDTVTLCRTPDDGDFTVTDRSSGKVLRGFYDLTALAKKDKYRVFLGGNAGRVSVRKTDAGDGADGGPERKAGTKKEGADRPTLLCVKDSYALSMLPFLARHFDVELIDPRYYGGSIEGLLTEEGQRYDAVLVLLGVDTMAEGAVLRRVAPTE